MEQSIVSIILIFNIILMILYFVMKINRRAVDRAREAYTEAVAEEEKKVITIDDHQKIESFISDPSIPATLSQKPTFAISIDNTNLLFIEKGKVDKRVNGLGVIITSTKYGASTNFSPLIFLNTTKKNAFYIKSDTKNYIGFFTPFHIVLIDPDTMNFTRSVEDEKSENTEDISVTSYTRNHDIVEHFVLKVASPFVDACKFVETYYPGDFKDYINLKSSGN
jgi:hypothetical protein